jgi:hypothetical protein
MKNILSDEDRKNLIVRINNLTENDKGVGRNMDKKEWTRLAYVHINYHLKQSER